MARKNAKKKPPKKKTSQGKRAKAASISVRKTGTRTKRVRKEGPPTSGLGFASVAAVQGTLLPGQCDIIASDCVRRITQSGRAYDRNDTLQHYGVNSAQQALAIVDLIIGDKEVGVGRDQFKIVDTSKIGGLAASWTMGQLANTIQSSAIPV
jgi:hypothetical protein